MPITQTPLKKGMLKVPNVKPFKSMLYCGITTPSLPKNKWLNLDCFDEDIIIESNDKGVYVNEMKLHDWADKAIDELTLRKVKRYFKTMIVAAIEAEKLYKVKRSWHLADK